MPAIAYFPNIKLPVLISICLLGAADFFPVYCAEIKNDFVKIVVAENGRFTMGNIKGDPENPNDDEKILVYGHPNPGTSFSTVRVSGTDYVFGTDGAVTKSVTASETKIECAWTYDGIVVTQNLSFFKGYSTGRMDTMKLEYRLKNTGGTAKEAGIRVMIDTMLGDNDAAPFRILGLGGVTTERTFDNDPGTAWPDIPQYWQAFDRLSSPKVQAQGTLSGGIATKPNKFITANWGGTYNTKWDYATTSGQSTGDSSVCVYWNPKTLNPGEERSYATLYGLGGITFVSWEPFSIGVSAPEFLELSGNTITPDPFTVVAYIENSAAYSAAFARAKIIPGRGTYLSPEDTEEKDIEYVAGTKTLNPAQIAQAEWKLKPRGSYMGYVDLYVRVTYNNSFVDVKRKIYLPGPANALFGIITDEAEKPLPASSIQLYRDNILRLSTAPFSDGTFILGNLPATDYTLKVSCPNYSSRIIDTRVAEEQTLAANNYIALKLASSGAAGNKIETYPYPNPCISNYSRIMYYMSGGGTVKIKLFTAGGDLLRTIEKTADGAGYYSADWEITDVPNGVYLYTVEAEDGGVSKTGYNKIVILKGLLK